MIIHLSRISPKARRIFIRRGATIPEDFWRAGYPSSVLSCTTWGFSCLANCSASGELLPRLFTLACTSFKEPAVSFSVTLSVNVRFGERRPRILRGMLPYGVRTFLQRTASGPPAIICHPKKVYHNQESRKAGAVEIASERQPP
jgi:hypothetical protein